MNLTLFVNAQLEFDIILEYNYKIDWTT